MHALARLGGDEFTILLTPQPEDTEQGRPAILESLAHPFSIEGHRLSLTSIGISIFPSDGSTVEALLKNADTAHVPCEGTGPEQFIITIRRD